MRVVPEKTERCSDQRSAKYGELGHARDVSDVEVGGPAIIAAHIGEYCQRTSRNHGAANREAIESVRQVYRVRRPGNDDRNKNQKRNERERPQMWRRQQRMNDQVWMNFLQKRNNQYGGIRATRR